MQGAANQSLSGHRSRVISTLREHGERLRPYSLKLNAELMPPDVFKISRGMNVLMLAVLVDAFDLPDKDIARCFWHGFQAIGVIADSFAHRPLQPPSTLQLLEFKKESREIMLGNEEWADEVERIVTRRNTAAGQSEDTRQRLAAIIETTEKELSRGLISGGLSRGQAPKTLITHQQREGKPSAAPPLSSFDAERGRRLRVGQPQLCRAGHPVRALSISAAHNGDLHSIAA